ncbi:BQ2448_5771 [Microbotryum intermedium]|uniref:BQ2448_5771 protein n=1 Tax=Microbotryum intermedium TaxID=269621 RepID=A0A238F291_9BASI|nr:BQ2448_5771 [Microbotryum intermedium]
MRFAWATRLAVFVAAVPWLSSCSRGSSSTSGLVTAQDVAPLLAYALPNSFPALDELVSDELPSPLVFTPGIDPCGSLLVISIPKIRDSDLALFPHQRINSTSGALLGSGLIDSYELAPSKGIARAVSGQHVMDWSDAWVKTCAGDKGEEYMNELRVAKVHVDWDQAVGSKARRETMVRLGQSQSIAVSLLVSTDQELAAHLTALPDAPHPHLVLLTSLTPRQLMHLMDLSSQISHPKPKPISLKPRLPPYLSTPTEDVVQHASARGLSHFFGMLFRLAFWGIVLSGSVVHGKQYLEQRRIKQVGFRSLGTGDGLPH